ncbi:MAG: glycosyltransferase [Alphaproteobacteria bacterium]|nr:glycosyltransferase [Alphaproteobacteria bacterium]
MVVVVKGYPRLSETFVAAELRALERRGFDLVIVSLRHPSDAARHPVHAAIRAPVVYLPEYLHDEPRRVARALAAALARRGFASILGLWWRDFRRDPTRNRGRRLGQALVLAREVLRPGDRLYAHFIHTPGSVARYAARLTGTPLAFAAHAKDIWTIPEWEKREKLADARFAVTCTAVGAEHLGALAPGKVHLVYHGLDVRDLPDPPVHRAAAGPVEILCVARIVPKKGLDVLLRALAQLPARPDWRFVHIGGGDAAPLEALADELGIAERARFLGPRPAGEVWAAYRRADVFALASRIAPDGDRDGLPNVLMEAASQEVAVVATTVGAIPELIQDEVHGLLVPPDDPDAFATALGRLVAEPELRRRLARAGGVRVRRRFDREAGIDRLAALLTDGAVVADAA